MHQTSLALCELWYHLSDGGFSLTKKRSIGQNQIAFSLSTTLFDPAEGPSSSSSSSSSSLFMLFLLWSLSLGLKPSLSMASYSAIQSFLRACIDRSDFIRVGPDGDSGVQEHRPRILGILLKPKHISSSSSSDISCSNLATLSRRAMNGVIYGRDVVIVVASVLIGGGFDQYMMGSED
ncbi:hypothetical protein Tco_0525166 [Tanacetum coccineum]